MKTAMQDELCKSEVIVMKMPEKKRMTPMMWIPSAQRSVSKRSPRQQNALGRKQRVVLDQ